MYIRKLMPRKYPDETKRQAIGMLETHADISFVHYSTGVHRRTLRRWHDELRKQQNAFMSEKVSASDIKRTQNINNLGLSQIADQSSHAKADLSDASTNAEYDDFTYIRDQLMQYARQMAGNLRPGESDSNRRTLALSRILDRIHWLDQILPAKIPEQDQAQERPPWQDARDNLYSLDVNSLETIKAEQTAGEVDDRLRGRVYDYYAKRHRQRDKSSR